MKRKSLSAIISMFVATLTLTGCSSEPRVPNNVSNHGSSSVTPSQAPRNQNMTTNTPNGGVISSHPTSLNVVKDTQLSLGEMGSHFGQSTFAPQFGPDFLNLREGFVGTPTGLMYTPDGGQSWHRIPSPAGNLEDVAFTTSRLGWAVTQTGSMTSGSPSTFTIYQTANAGASWTKQWTQTANDDMSSAQIFTLSTQSRIAVVANELLKQNNGSSWSEIHLPVSGPVVDADFVTGKFGWVVIEQKQPAASPNHAATSVLVVLHTTDGGNHWTVELRTAPFLGDGASIAFSSASDGLLLYKDTATMNTAEYRTTNGGASWTKSMPPALSGRLFAERPIFSADGSVWLPLSAGAGPFASSILQSDNVGKTWHTVSEHGAWRSLMLSTRFGNTAYLLAGLFQGYALLKTANNGKTWTQMLPGVAPTTSVSFISSTVGYALGTEANSDAILKTTDGGSTWVTIGTLPEGTKAYDIAFVNESVGYVTTAPARTTSGIGNTVIMETKDGGKTWTSAPFGALPKSVLNGISKNQNIVDPVYFHPPSQVNGNDWVLGATGYPTLYMMAAGTHGTNVGAMYSDPPGAIEAYAFLSPKDGWMSVLKTAKSGSPNGQSLIMQFDRTQKKWVPVWTLPAGWSIEGMSRLNATDAWLLAQKPWTSMHPTVAIYRTTDSGRSWTRYEKTNAPDLYAPPTSGTSAFPMDFVNPNDGWLLTQQGLWKTTDGGASWKPVT